MATRRSRWTAAFAASWLLLFGHPSGGELHFVHSAWGMGALIAGVALVGVLCRPLLRRRWPAIRGIGAVVCHLR
jgi:hypothetical protein